MELNKPPTIIHEIPGAGRQANLLLSVAAGWAFMLTGGLTAAILEAAGLHPWPAIFVAVPLFTFLIHRIVLHNKTFRRRIEIDKDGISIRNGILDHRVLFADITKIYLFPYRTPMAKRPSSIQGENSKHLATIDGMLLSPQVVSIIERCGQVHGFPVIVEDV